MVATDKWIADIPDIWQFCYTATLFRPVKMGTPKWVSMWQSSQNGPKQAKILPSLCKKGTSLRKSTSPLVVAVVTNISYELSDDLYPFRGCLQLPDCHQLWLNFSHEGYKYIFLRHFFLICCTCNPNVQLLFIQHSRWKYFTVTFKLYNLVFSKRVVFV